jgi:hypothetical protein
MGFLDDLLGGGQRQKDLRDFVSRYDQGHPSEGYSDQEVLDRYRDVAHEIPPDQYAQAAQDSLARLSPEERAALLEQLQQRARARGVPLPTQVGSSPRDLGGMLSDLHKTPGQLRDLLGGGGGAPSAAASPAQTGGVSGMLSSPLAKAALAGIAAMVVKRYMHGR